MSVEESIARFFPDQLVVNATTVCVVGDTVSLYSGGEVPVGGTVYTYSRDYGRVEIKPAASYSAEEWITQRGFGSIRLVTLLDLEAKLNSANQSAPKLNATRQWLDSITVSYAADPSPRYNWPIEPESFEEVIQEAVGILAQIQGGEV